MLSVETHPNGSPATASRTLEKADESRRIQRIALPLPMRVEALLDRNNGWNEMTRLIDVSPFGAGFLLKRPLKRGRLVLLTLPMPRQLRSFDYAESQYKIWALVRRCLPVGSAAAADQFAIGTAFTGKKPPDGSAGGRQRPADRTAKTNTVLHSRASNDRANG